MLDIDLNQTQKDTEEASERVLDILSMQVPDAPMAPQELSMARTALCLKLPEMAKAIGYSVRYLQIFESGERPIPLPVKYLVEAYLRGYRPSHWPGNRS